MKKKSKQKYFLYALIILLILLIKGAIYSDISVEELKKEYTNEHSKFIEFTYLGCLDQRVKKNKQSHTNGLTCFWYYGP